MLFKSLGLVLALFFPTLAFAENITIEWDGSPTAISYTIEQSFDSGVNWFSALKVSAASACKLTKCSAVYNAPSTGLILFRIVTVNNVGSSIRSKAGFWYNAKWTLPAAAGSAEIK